MRIAGLTMACILVLVSLGAAASAHNGSTAVTCSYELSIDDRPRTIEDPTGLTTDERLDLGGCTWMFPASGGEPDPMEDTRTVDKEWNRAEPAIVDDVWGIGVGGVVCNDGDGDGVCGELHEDEQVAAFCSSPALLTSEKDWDGDGHDDFGASLRVEVNGPLRQALQCEPQTAPTGTSGGLLNPAAGIFVTLSG